jgi:hypothetical protein
MSGNVSTDDKQRMLQTESMATDMGINQQNGRLAAVCCGLRLFVSGCPANEKQWLKKKLIGR